MRQSSMSSPIAAGKSYPVKSLESSSSPIQTGDPTGVIGQYPLTTIAAEISCNSTSSISSYC